MERIEEILRLFTEGNVQEASVRLLSHLHIPHTQELPSPIQYRDYYDRGEIPQYIECALTLCREYYYIGEVCDDALAGRNNANTDLCEDLKKLRDNAHYKSMMLFAVDLRTDAHITRTDLSALTRAFNRLVYNYPATVIFRQGQYFSISTCERTEYKQESQKEQGEKLGKVCLLRDVNCINTQRGHIDILNSIYDKKYNTFDELYKHWMEVFSSELLTEKFYNELQNWYFWAVKNVAFPNDLSDDKDDKKYNNENVIRLITRFIFVWFLKEKGLVNPDLFEVEKLSHILKDFKPLSNDTNYYVGIIQNLFFATLNQEIANRQFVAKWDPNHHGIKTLFRNKQLFMDADNEEKIISLFNQSPYVNGSLFECLDDKERDGKTFFWDGFSENNTTKDGKLKQAVISNYLFFTSEKGEEVDMQIEYNKDAPYNVNVSGLLNILERYHFTIEENTPLDEDVALDPELLGRAFENLLGAFNPETQRTARENTGSYYTPRDIVIYMVSESMLAHLKTRCPDIPQTILESVIDFNITEKPKDITEQQINQIVEAVYNCHVLDPACGSGAFPMGILQLLVHILRKLDDNNKYWYNIVLEQALEEVRLAGNETEEERQRLIDEINMNFDDKVNDPDYARKLYIIEKCIFGVDIQTVAVQISRLRCFISLLCEQSINHNPEENYGIKPLPNLESNFVAANTLFSLNLTKEESALLRENDVALLVKQLREIRHLLFLPRDKKMKMRLREKDAKLRQEIKTKVGEVYALRLKEAIDLQQEAIDSITIWLDTEGVGIEDYKIYTEEVTDLFGNITTVKKKANTKKTEMLQKLRMAYKERNRLNHQNRLSQIMQKIDRLVSWDPFDQNVSNSYFEPNWMFGISEKFDIVIGNPPYISAEDQNNDTRLLAQRELLSNDNRFKTLYLKWDLYIAFLELSIRYLTKESGICTMIIPLPFTIQRYGLQLRKHIVEEEDLLEIVDLNGIKVFKNASVFNCIPFIRHSHVNCRTIISKGKKEEHINITHDFEQHYTNLVQNPKTQIWNLSQEVRKSNRHPNMHKLGDYCFISYGLRPNSDEKKAKGEFKKKHLISDTRDDIPRREYVEGKDIERYKIKNIRYLEYGTERSPAKLVRPTFKEWFNIPKLMFSKFGGLAGIINASDYLLHNDTVIGVGLWKDLIGIENNSISSVVKKYCTLSRETMEELSQTMNLRYLLGVLNSTYAMTLLSDIRGDDFNTYPEYIRNIPIPFATIEQQRPIIELVNKILVAKMKNPDTDTSALEQEIDRLVYTLYGVDVENNDSTKK